jgi:pyrroloquinoline quinone biosynthesis protein B
MGSRAGVRTTGIEAILLTNADLDHVLGLYILREGSPLTVYATQSVRASLSDGLAIDNVLARYCGLNWREPAMEESDLLTADGAPSGLRYLAFPLSGKLPRYRRDNESPLLAAIGYQISDSATGGRMLFAPDLAAWNADLSRRAADCDAVLIDGTFWSNDELSREGAGNTTASEMGHLPIAPPGGSLPLFAQCNARFKVYIHINNTNPILREDSRERQIVNDAGIIVGRDGLELNL